MNKSLSFNQYIEILTTDRVIMQRIFYIFALIALLLNFKDHISLHQIGGNPLLYQEIDVTYWLFMILNLPEIIGVKFSFLFDLVLTASCLLSIIWPKQRITPTLFFITYFINFVLYNMMAGHHYSNIGLLFMSFPFIFSSPKNFAFSFLFLRFVFCFIIFSAAVWKIVRGNIFHPDQMFSLLTYYHAGNMISNNLSWREMMIDWLLHYKFLVHSIWIILIILEGVFVLGFITLRFDLLLLISYLLFFTGGWLFLDIYSYENLVFLLTLGPVIMIINRGRIFEKSK